MIREKNPLIELKFTDEKSSILEFCNSIMESFYTLFELILEDPIENFWFECFNIILGYMQLMCYIMDSTVNNKIIYNNYTYSFIQFGFKKIY